MIIGDADLVVEPNQHYQFMLRWQAGEVFLNIYDNQARSDFSFGDYLCEDYMDMLAVFGQDGENAEVTVSDFAVDGLCPVPEKPVEDKFCCEADFCAAEVCGAVFDPCENFDEYECSEGCDVSLTVQDPITLTGMQQVEVHELNGVQKRCSELKVSFKLRTAASFTQKPYLRQFFKLTKTAANNFPVDSRPSLYIDSQNRILLANSPFLTVNNRWTTKNYFFWPTGMQAGKGDAEMFNTDSTMRVVADTLYRVFFPKMSHLGVKHGHLGPFLSQKT